MNSYIVRALILSILNHSSHDSHHCNHNHSHDHTHGSVHGHHHIPQSFGKAFAVGISLNLIYIFAEVIWGIVANSLALIADAGHNLSDVFALASAWGASYLSKKKPSPNFTYGFRRTSILVSLGNAILLLIVTGGIIWESIERFYKPAPVTGKTVIFVALLGVIINGITALMFQSGQKEDLNIKGAFLHMTYDALLSLSVAGSGIIIALTHWNILDPIISLIVALIIIWGTWSLLKDSVTLAMDGVPSNINAAAVESYLRSLPNIIDLHDLHIWAMSTTETALTVHLVSSTIKHPSEFLSMISNQLKKQFKIGHSTFQIEQKNEANLCDLAKNRIV